MDVEKFVVDMNNLPDYVRDEFESVKNNYLNSELVNIEHHALKINGEIDTEFWDLAFYEEGAWLTFIKISYQPWNPEKVHRDYVTVSMRRMECIYNRVEEIRNGNL
jgi:hypothetical protein